MLLPAHATLPARQLQQEQVVKIKTAKSLVLEN
jgi:hypothetical protein